MPTYEYKIVHGGFAARYEIVLRRLNEEAKDGWRLVPGNVSNNGLAFVIEREVASEEAPHPGPDYP